MGKCYFCETEYSEGKIHFSDSCLKCELDLHICFNCEFFDELSPDQCRESSADRVVEKDKKNFCDYFSVAKHSLKNKISNKEKVLSEAEALFKK